MDYPKFIVSYQKEEFISMQRVNMNHQSPSKNVMESALRAKPTNRQAEESGWMDVITVYMYIWLFFKNYEFKNLHEYNYMYCQS